MTAASRAHSLVGDSAGRPELDFYPTPPEATRALLAVESFPQVIWEPAAGNGAIVKVLSAAGHQVIATDIKDYGFPLHRRVDFLTPKPRALVRAVITNPPFKYAQEFAEQGLHVASEKMALLVKLAFLEGVKRREFFRAHPPARVWVFSKRLSLTRNGEPMKNSGMIAFAWFVWEKGYTGKPIIDWV